MPALALGRELKKRGYCLHFLTDDRGLSYFKGVEDEITVLPLKRKGGVRGKISYLYSLAESTLKAFTLLKRGQSKAVISFGGYITFPANLVACLKRLPLILHEQNAFMGLVNRLFASQADRVALSMPLSNQPFWPSRLRATITGMPVREGFYEARQTPYSLVKGQDTLHLLVIGGSQGALSFTQVVPRALRALPDDIRQRIKVSFQAGHKTLDASPQKEESLTDFDGDVAPFFTDMPQRLGSADFVIARAGASTVAELLAVGRPSLLIPYPYAAGNHQVHNAQALVKKGAGWMMLSEDFTAQTLSSFLSRVLSNPAALVYAAACARQMGQNQATTILADCCQQVIEKQGVSPCVERREAEMLVSRAPRHKEGKGI